MLHFLSAVYLPDERDRDVCRIHIGGVRTVIYTQAKEGTWKSFGIFCLGWDRVPGKVGIPRTRGVFWRLTDCMFFFWHIVYNEWLEVAAGGSVVYTE
jgi:hypothetical protein